MNRKLNFLLSWESIIKYHKVNIINFGRTFSPTSVYFVAKQLIITSRYYEALVGLTLT